VFHISIWGLSPPKPLRGNGTEVGNLAYGFFVPMHLFLQRQLKILFYQQAQLTDFENQKHDFCFIPTWDLSRVGSDKCGALCGVVTV